MKKSIVTYSARILLVVLAIGALACNRKSDSWTSRTYHKMTSKFNPYFNGEEAYIEGVASIQENHKDDYEEILDVYRWGTPEQATSIAPQMDRAIEKSVKVIKDHSMVISGKQKNVYVIKSYMLMGKARFYKHDYFPALETFNYVIQQFSKDKKAVDLVAESRLWAARCQILIGNALSAESYLDEIYNNKRITKKLKADISATRAQMFIDKKDYESAVESLMEALKEKPKKQNRIRWTFIMAQLHERLDNNYEASRAYKDVIDMKPANYEMLFTAQLNRAKNFDVYMENSNIVYRELEKMLKDEKNIEYRDQIYYVMAEVALAEEEFDKAEGYLRKSIRASTNNKTQKGLSYLLVADINFEFKEYVPAQAYYDSASTTLPQKHKKFAMAKKRAESLKGLVDNINIIALEDSLQRVAGMSESAQRKLYERYIEDLKEEEERQKREQELKELNEQLVNESRNMAGGPNVGSTQGWYFYNANARSSGIAAFQNNWGNRDLEDNWRQSNKQQNIEDPFATTDTTQTTSNNKALADKYNPDYYLEQIPKTQEDIDSSNARIMKAYVSLGDIYKQELSDYTQSAASFSSVLDRFPGCKYEPRVLYSLYRLQMDQQKDERAEPYKTELVSKYPSSIYTKLILEPGKMDKNDEGYKKAAELYKKEFELYQKGKYKTVVRDLEKQKTIYENSLLEPKFALLKCMCVGKTKKKEEFVEALKEVVKKYPNTKEQIAAQEILNLVDEPAAATADGDAAGGSYTYEANTPHKYVAIVPNKGVNVNQLRNEFANYNQQYFKLERLQIQNIFFDQNTQMIVVSGFKNAAKAKVYYKGVATNQKIMGQMPQGSSTRIIISDKNYRDLYRDKNLSVYLNFLKDKYQIEDSL